MIRLFDLHTLIFFLCLPTYHGSFAGMFGVGGGIVKGTRIVVYLVACLFSLLIFYCTTRPFNVSYGYPPQSGFSNQCLHDSIHEFHRNDIIYGLWFIVTRLCVGVRQCWIFGHLCWSDWSHVSHEEVSAKLFNCFFYRWCCFAKRILDDYSIID